MKTEEGKIKDAVRAFLRERRVSSFTSYVPDAVGYYYMPVQASSFGSPTLDFIICYRGWFIVVETKKPGDKPTQRQQQIAQLVKTGRGVAVWGDDAAELCLLLAEIFDGLDEDA